MAKIGEFRFVRWGESEEKVDLDKIVKSTIF